MDAQQKTFHVIAAGPSPAYAGIGSRSTPADVLAQMRLMGSRLARLGMHLRSGGADGADSAFEDGALDIGVASSIFLPWPRFNGRASGIVPDLAKGGEIARLHHPAWERLTEGARRLHSRNSYQVLGEFLNDPARFVLCWTADGCEGAASRSKKTGGTGMAIAIADLHGIPVINMANEGWHAKLLTVLAGIPEMAGMRLPPAPDLPRQGPAPRSCSVRVSAFPFLEA